MKKKNSKKKAGKALGKDGCLLSLDIGTGSVRGILFNLRGGILQQEARKRHYLPDPSGEPFLQVFDSEILWGKICALVRSLLNKSGIPAEAVRAVSATCQRFSFLFLDKMGQALYAGPNLDTRGIHTQADIENRLGREFYQLTGQYPPLTSALARLLWFKRERPETFARIHTVLMLNDWALFKLSDALRSEATAASASGILEVKNRQWSRKIQKTFELDQSLFPPLAVAGEIIGEVTPDAASETGLKAGTPVVVSGADTQCGLLGGGLSGPDQIGIVAGTTAMFCRSMDTPFMDPEQRIWTSCHLEPKSWILEANGQWAGSVLQWIQELVENASNQELGRLNMYPWMEKLASKAPAGSGETFSFLGPIIMDQENFYTIRPGVFFFPPPAHPLTESPVQAGHFFRAILENIVFALRGNMEQVATVMPFLPDRIFLTGGLANNRLFCRIVSDCLNLPVFVGRVREASALGCTVCCAAGLGLFTNLAEAQKGLVQQDLFVEPQEKNRSTYETAYGRWKEIYRKIVDL